MVLYYCVRNSLVALLEAVYTRISFKIREYRFFSEICFSALFCVCEMPLSLTKAFLLPLSTRLLCLVVAISLVH